MSNELSQDLDDEDDDDIQCVDCDCYLKFDESDPEIPHYGALCGECLQIRYELLLAEKTKLEPGPATKAAIDDIAASLRKAKHLKKVGGKVFVAVYIEDKKAYLAEQGDV